MAELGQANIYQRMNAVMREVRGVAKTQTNSHGGYKYAGHEAVTAALRDAYVRHGIVRTADVLDETRDGGMLRMRVRVTWTNIDRPEDRVEVVMVGESPSVTKTGAPSPVQSGIALSYAVKNAEFKAFALTGDDTPDAEAEDDDRSARPQQQGGGGLTATSFSALRSLIESAQNTSDLAKARQRVNAVLREMSPDQRTEINALGLAAKRRIEATPAKEKGNA